MPKFSFEKPSQPGEKPSQEKEETTPEHKLVLEKINSLLEKEEDFEVQKFIEERVEDLERNTEPTQISAPAGMSSGENCFYSEHIHPETDIRRSLMVEPFHLDDPKVYSVLIEVLQEYKQMGESLEKVIPGAVQHTLTEYFGNPFGTSTTETKNREFYSKRAVPEKGPVSLVELKGKNIAVCAEKASLAHNLFRFLGFDSYLVLSQKCELKEGEKEPLHAYNIIKRGDKYFLFDPTNPGTSEHKATGKIERYHPAIYAISEEQFEEIEKGNTVKITHRDYKISETGERETEEKERVYGGFST